MIISKVSLSRAPGSQGTLAKLLLEGASGDRGHSLVWSLFAATGDEQRAFLYRRIAVGSFIIVSARPPEDAHHLWRIETKDYAPELRTGQRLRFVLRANPVISARMPGARRGKKVDAVMHAKFKLAGDERRTFDGGADAALDWLVARGPALGANFDRERCSATGYNQVIIRTGERDRKVRPITFSEIDYEGALTVADPEKLTTTLFTGVGKARSYGCGLLLVRPL
jgi:CRISPR system Cascade subunit CasE